MIQQIDIYDNAIESTKNKTSYINAEHQARDADGFLTPRQMASYKTQKRLLDTLERKKGELNTSGHAMIII